MPLHAPLRRHPAMRRSKSMRRLRGPMSVEDQFAEIRREKDYMFVGVGFSDLGYQNVAALHESFKRDIKPIIEKHGVKKVGFLAGATEPGVGALYQLAKQMGLDTYGLVSDSALHDSVPVSPYCDRVIFVRRKFPYDWAVKDANDRSHTVNAAVLGGAQGGGCTRMAAAMWEPTRAWKRNGAACRLLCTRRWPPSRKTCARDRPKSPVSTRCRSLQHSISTTKRSQEGLNVTP